MSVPYTAPTEAEYNALVARATTAETNASTERARAQQAETNANAQRTRAEHAEARMSGVWNDHHFGWADFGLAFFILLVGLLIAGGRLYYLTGDRMMDIGLHQGLPLLVGLIAALILVVVGATWSRMMNGYYAEWLSTSAIIAGMAIYMLLLIAMPAMVAHEMVSKNPTIDVNRGGEQWEVIKVQSLDLPKSAYENVHIFVQSEYVIPAAQANAITKDNPYVICVPKDAKGEVYFRVDDKPNSLASQY
jgi:hypothetical protein